MAGSYISDHLRGEKIDVLDPCEMMLHVIMSSYIMVYMGQVEYQELIIYGASLGGLNSKDLLREMMLMCILIIYSKIMCLAYEL